MRTSWFQLGCTGLLLAGFAIVSACAAMEGPQSERREKFRSERAERRAMKQENRRQAVARGEQDPAGERIMPQQDITEAERVARQQERRALLRRQINEARELYPQPTKP